MATLSSVIQINTELLLVYWLKTLNVTTGPAIQQRPSTTGEYWL